MSETIRRWSIDGNMVQVCHASFRITGVLKYWDTVYYVYCVHAEVEFRIEDVVSIDEVDMRIRIK